MKNDDCAHDLIYSIPIASFGYSKHVAIFLHPQQDRPL